MPTYINIKDNSLFYEKVSSSNKRAIIFLHGLGATHQFWGKEYYRLYKDYSLYFLDLLGFGQSSKPHGVYTLDKHVDAINTFIRNHVNEQEYIFVGHSLGAIISLAYTHTYPQHVNKSILLGLPYYHSEIEAHRIIQKVTKYPRWFYTQTIPSQLIYTIAQALALPASTFIAPFFFPDLPPQVLNNIFLHSYNALITTVSQTIIKQDIPHLISDYIRSKVIFIHGVWDTIAPIQNIQELSKIYRLPLYNFPGNHDFPIRSSKETVDLLNHYFF